MDPRILSGGTILTALDALASRLGEAVALREHLLTVPARGWPSGAVEEALVRLDSLMGFEAIQAPAVADAEMT